jgi:alkylhydroperoxidase family enzyme
VTAPLDRLRAVVRDTAPPPDAMAAYLAKVRTAAYKVTDGDVDALRAAGLSEDVIFEQTVAAAVGEGLRRFDAFERALG